MSKNLIKCAICVLGIIINIDKCISMSIIIPGCIEGETSTILHEAIERNGKDIQEAINYPESWRDIAKDVNSRIDDITHLSIMHLNVLIKDYHIPIDIKDSQGNTSLCTAFELGNITIIDYLLKNRANINTVNSYNENIMFSAVLSDNIMLLDFLKNKGINIDSKNDFGDTPLFSAIRFGCLNSTVWLIDNGADIYHINDNQQNLLFPAIESGNLNLVKTLIEKGKGYFNVNATDRDNMTPAMLSLEKNNLDIFEYFLDNNVPLDINIIDSYGNNLFLYLTNGYHIFYMDEMNRLVTKFIEKYPNTELYINSKNKIGTSPLMQAIEYQDLELIKLLLKFDVDVASGLEFLNKHNYLDRSGSIRKLLEKTDKNK